MEPISRKALGYPIYAMDLLSPTTLAIAGGGGRMKSGVPNECAVLSFDTNSATLSSTASVSLPDAPVALATSGSTILTIIGSGCKNFVHKPGTSTLKPTSHFEHDLRVHSTQEQSAIAVSANAETLVIASDEGHVSTISLPHYEPLHRSRLHAQGVTDLSVTADGALVASTARDRTAYVWRAASGEIVQTLQPVMPVALGTHVRAVRFVTGKAALMFTVESNPRKGGWIAARRRERDDGQWEPVADVKASSDALTAFTVNDAGDMLAVSSAEGHVAVFRWNGTSFSKSWSTETKTDWFRNPQAPHVLPVTAMRFSPHSDHLFTASADYTVAVWPTHKPTSWRAFFRLSFWLAAVLVALLAVLIAEDHHLHDGVLRQRRHVEPYLQPQLEQFRSHARPFLRKRKAEVEPHMIWAKESLEPHASHVLDRVAVYVNHMRSLGLEGVAPILRRFTQTEAEDLAAQMSSSGSLKGHKDVKRVGEVASTVKEMVVVDDPTTVDDAREPSAERTPDSMEGDHVDVLYREEGEGSSGDELQSLSPEDTDTSLTQDSTQRDRESDRKTSPDYPGQGEAVEFESANKNTIHDEFIENDSVKPGFAEDDSIIGDTATDDSVTNEFAEDDFVIGDTDRNGSAKHELAEDDTVIGDSVKNGSVRHEFAEDDSVVGDTVTDDSVMHEVAEDNITENESVHMDTAEEGSFENDYVKDDSIGDESAASTIVDFESAKGEFLGNESVDSDSFANHLPEGEDALSTAQNAKSDEVPDVSEAVETNADGKGVGASGNGAIYDDTVGDVLQPFPKEDTKTFVSEGSNEPATSSHGKALRNSFNEPKPLEEEISPGSIFETLLHDDNTIGESLKKFPPEVVMENGKTYSEGHKVMENKDLLDGSDASVADEMPLQKEYTSDEDLLAESESESENSAVKTEPMVDPAVSEEIVPSAEVIDAENTPDATKQVGKGNGLSGTGTTVELEHENCASNDDGEPRSLGDQSPLRSFFRRL